MTGLAPIRCGLARGDPEKPRRDGVEATDSRHTRARGRAGDKWGGPGSEDAETLAEARERAELLRRGEEPRATLAAEANGGPPLPVCEGASRPGTFPPAARLTAQETSSAETAAATTAS